MMMIISHESRAAREQEKEASKILSSSSSLSRMMQQIHRIHPDSSHASVESVEFSHLCHPESISASLELPLPCLPSSPFSWDAIYSTHFIMVHVLLLFLLGILIFPKSVQPSPQPHQTEEPRFPLVSFLLLGNFFFTSLFPFFFFFHLKLRLFFYGHHLW